MGNYSFICCYNYFNNSYVEKRCLTSSKTYAHFVGLVAQKTRTRFNGVNGMSFKTTIITLIFITGGYQLYKEYFIEPVLTVSVPERKINKPTFQKSWSSSRFSCDERQHCSQMTSRSEALYFIRNCPNTKMDGDNDGVPCERDSRW